jgi:hypothetical protein
MGADEQAVADAQPVNQEKNEAERKSRYDTFSPSTASGQFIECFDCFYLIDVDGDYKPRLRRYLTDRKGTIFLEEAAPVVPIAAGAIMLAGHEHSGVSLFEKIKPTQDSKTQGLRQYVDNMVANNNRRIAVAEGEVPDMNQLTSSVPGGVIVTKGMPREVIAEIALSDIGPSCLTFLQYMDTVRSESGGASLDMQGGEAQIMANQSFASVDRQYSAKEKLAAYFHRNFEETLVYSLYVIAHAMLRAYWPEPIRLKTGQGWQSANPTQWPERDAVQLKQGKRKSDALATVLQTQQMAMQAGMDGILVDDTKIYNAVMDMARAGNIANPDQYYIDPSSDQAKQAKQAKAQQAQQAQQMQMQAQQMVFQTQTNIETMKALVDRANQLSELSYKYWSDTLKAEVDEAKIVGAGTAQLQALQLSGTIASASADAKAEEAEPEATT